jgi:hypothetical protein
VWRPDTREHIPQSFVANALRAWLSDAAVSTGMSHARLMQRNNVIMGSDATGLSMEALFQIVKPTWTR